MADDLQTAVQNMQANDALHIRTYAKDAALLTGKPLPEHVQNVPAPAPTPAPAPKPRTDIPDLSAQAGAGTPQSRDELLAALRAKSAGTTLVQPGMPAREPVIGVDSTDEARQAILARLKENAITVPEVPVQAPVVPEAHEAPPGIPPVRKDGLSPIHTYKSDFAERTRKQNATPLSILAAEQNAYGSARPQPLAQKTQRFPWFAAVGALVLVIAGGAGVYAAWQYVSDKTHVPASIFVPSLVFADSRVEVSGADKELQSALANLSGANIPDGGVVVAYVTYASTTPAGTTVRVPASGGELIKALALPAPDILLRNTLPESTAGGVKEHGRVYPFFILRVASFERTFAGMLAWEKTLGDDLSILYPPYAAETASSTPASSSTPAALTYLPAAFVDGIVDNHDVRALRDTAGNTVLLYGYADKQTLVIARSPEAFTVILDRLASTRAQ